MARAKSAPEKAPTPRPPRPTRRVAVTLFKGGVGKSTVAVSAAVGLARRGRRVCLIDLDSQASATDMLGAAGKLGPDATAGDLTGTSRPNSAPNPGMAGVIVEGLPPAAVAVAVEPNLTLLPASRALAGVETWLTTQLRREELLARRLAGLTGYEYVILDTPPAYSLLNVNALTYVDELWLPLLMDYLSLSGAAQVLETLTTLRRELGRAPIVRHVIPNMVDARLKRTAEVLAAAEQTFGSAVTPTIRNSTKLAEAPSHHQSIFDLAPGSPGAEDFGALLEHIDSVASED